MRILLFETASIVGNGPVPRSRPCSSYIQCKGDNSVLDSTAIYSLFILSVCNCRKVSLGKDTYIFVQYLTRYMEMMEMKPIGWMKSLFLYKNGTPRQSSVCPLARGTITIDKTVFNNPQHAVEDLQEYSHIWIIFLFHQNNNEHFKAKVRPPRLGGKRLGVFSTRSPYRPNPIGLTLAKLDRVKGSTLYVSGIDILDGTPILDIKPYIPDYDQPRVDSLASYDQEICQDVSVDVSRFSSTCDLENGLATLDQNIIKGNTCHDSLSDDFKNIDECFGFVNRHSQNNSNQSNNILKKFYDRNGDISSETSVALEILPSRTMVGHAPIISELSAHSLRQSSDITDSSLSKADSSQTRLTNNKQYDVIESKKSDFSKTEKAPGTFAPIIMSEMELTTLESSHKRNSKSKHFGKNTANLDNLDNTETKTLKPVVIGESKISTPESMNKNAFDPSHSLAKSLQELLSMEGKRDITPDSTGNSSCYKSDEKSIIAVDDCSPDKTCENTNTACFKNDKIVQKEFVKEGILKPDNSVCETTVNAVNAHQSETGNGNQCSSVFSSVRIISSTKKDGELDQLPPHREHINACFKNTNAEIKDKNKVKTATWLKTSENTKLSVRFTPTSLNELIKFSQMSNDSDFLMKFLKNSCELKEAIQDILKCDPRSIYRKTSCRDSLYYFTVDIAHVTCWFDDDNYVAEVLRVQPFSEAKFESK